MYLHHELREVCESRQTEALERIGTLHRLMQAHPGFIRSFACRYLGSTSQYAWFRIWDSAGDHAGFRKTEASKAFGATKPDGLYWQLPNAIAADAHWNLALESGEQGSGDLLLRQAFSVPSGEHDTFLKARELYDKLALDGGHITSCLLFELAPPAAAESEPSKHTFVSLTRTESIAAYRALLESPALVAQSETKPLVTECYEIVEELTRP